MERLPVRDVPDVALEERHPACRVDGFENERSSGRQFVICRFEKTHQVPWFEVLDDLNGHEAAQTAVGLTLDELERIPSLDLEAARATELHHRIVAVEPARHDSLLAQQIEKLATPAADVQNIRS